MFYGFLTIVTVLIRASDAQCNPTSSGNKRYGKDCTNTCHCINKEQCDAKTGNCTSGCDFNWVGPGCQFENVAFRKSSRNIDNINPPMYSDRANDGDVSTCSYTGTADTPRTDVPWWTLWWPKSTIFRKLVFVTKEHYLPQLPNFKLIVQNFTKSDFQRKVYSTSGEVCYQHDASIPHETTVHVTCDGMPKGNLIRLQLANTSTQLVICDFRVYKGCQMGFFGPNCSERCSRMCRYSGQFTCDNIDGKCLNGCYAGWKGKRCENECERGQWGRRCASTCGYCFSATCNKINGHCPYGCNAGYKHTNLCIEKCERGQWGRRCESTCGHCFSATCNKRNGHCPNGCDAGYKPTDLCIEKCELGQWGRECASTCGHCFSASCDNRNGHCPNGCDPGYKPTDLCIEKCSNGYYGKDCTHQCSSTCSLSSGKDICDHANGTCLNGCKAGWKGVMCESECEPGQWGRDCTSTCGHCFSATCNTINGHCPEGCEAGYKHADMCIEKCLTGRWGISCANSCGKCLSGNCRHTDGVCYGGCAAGVKSTPHCDKDCNDGSFGFNCTGVCSNNCKGVCSKKTGGCEYCNSGWHGENCSQECADGRWGENCKRTCVTCNTETCNRISGACYSYCKPGYKQTKFCDQECSSGWYGFNCSEECTSNCRNITLCRKTDGSCIECKPGLEGKICDKDTEEQAEKSMHISVGGFAAIVVTFIVLNFFSVFLSIFVLRRRQHRNQTESENETVTYANVLAAEGNSASLNTPASNVNVEMKSTYDTLKRTSGIEHVYE